MERIGNDLELINFFSEKESLTSSYLKKVEIYEESSKMVIKLRIELASSKIVMLKFLEVDQYCFYHTSDYSFSTIEIIKFFKAEKGIYISLDPVDEKETFDSEDNDFILCKEVEEFLIEL